MLKAKTSTQRRWERTFDGCGTCRRRHVRCDQTHPACRTCLAVGVQCDGFKFDLRWIPHTIDGQSGAAAYDDQDQPRDVVRRHLYSERTRKRMADSLGVGLTRGSVDASLHEIDGIADKTVAGQQHNADVAVGPFGMLQFPRSAPAPIDEISPDREIALHQSLDANNVVHSTTTPGEAIEISHFDNIEYGGESHSMNDLLQWDDLFGLAHQDSSQSSLQLLDPLFGLSNAMPIDRQVQRVQPDIALQQGLNVSERGIDPRLESSPVTQSTPALSLPSYAPVLLKHFRDVVMGHMSAVPTMTKSPWDVVNLTAAVDTYARMFVMEDSTITSAKRAGLYGILAMSAGHLAKNPRYDSDLHRPDGFFKNVAQLCKSHATQELQASLKSESYGPGRAKYKDQMGAIMNMLGFAIQNGEQSDARCYMVDAERLMRYRGIAKPAISRKSRLLHHVYTWERIVSESTYVLHDYNKFVEKLRNQDCATTLPSSEHLHTTRLDDFLRLESASEIEEESPQTQNTETDQEEIALRDMHLVDACENPNTMMHTIYGVSETWLRLLSQTTRLANQMDAIKSSDYGPVPEGLVNKASQLEEKICMFAASQPDATASTELHMHLHTALNSALVIFFYRRIRSVNAWILQSQVDSVIQALNRFDRELERHHLEGPGLVWPAFIAGCEATTPLKREHLLHWIRRAALKTQFQYYNQAIDTLELVWNSSKPELSSDSRNAASSPSTWMGVLREKQIWLIAC